MKGSDVESITKLLKAHGVKLSAVRANKLLMDIGMLEEATRESATRPGVIKTYKVVTERGLDFGVNEENPQSPGQSSPYWYKDSFAELARMLVEADEAPLPAPSAKPADDSAKPVDETGGGAEDGVDDRADDGADDGAGSGGPSKRP